MEGARVELSLHVWRQDTPEGDPRILVRAPFHLATTCASLLGARWSPNLKAWHVPATTAAAGDIAAKFHGAEFVMDSHVRALVAKSLKLIEAQKLKGAVDLPTLPVRTDAWLHQRRAYHFASHLDAAMLAMDMGTGKSLVQIALLEHHKARRILILCPVSVLGVWPKQFREHALDPEEFELIGHEAGRVPISRSAQAILRRAELAEKRGRRPVVCVNYDAAWRPAMGAMLSHVDWDAVVLDESHRAKAAGSKIGKFTARLRPRARRRTCSTGTPMPHSPLDIYGQYRFLDPAIFGTSKNRFMNRYAITEKRERRDGRTYEAIIDWQNQGEFAEKFRSIAYVVTKDEALPDLPPKLPPVEYTFSLKPAGLRLYNTMAKHLIAEVGDGGFIVAANSLSKVMRLRQITSGHGKLDDGTVLPVDDGREHLLQDILEDIPSGEPVVVYCVFRADLDAIERVCERLGRRFGELSGRRRDGLTADATMNPDIDVLGCQIKSGGVGIDLTRSRTAIYYSIGYELGDIMQSEDRLHRPGQTRPVRYIHLLAENAAIDRVMYESAASKRDIINAITEAARHKEL